MNRSMWYGPNGEMVACAEKMKVMQQNIDELRQVAQDAFEDGVLMGIDQEQLRRCFAQLMLNLHMDK
ncbi:MAG: hypothetical protein KBD37_00945 [Burkholderiales bacterium]|nr:hypothetical protein [Burkholderiales bacterium]